MGVTIIGYGPAGAASVEHRREDLTAIVDGSEVVFATASNFVAGTTEVFLNGLLQTSAGDYAERPSLDAIEFLTAPIVGDRVVIVYVQSEAP